jgi:hypothetical protein
VNKAYQRRWTVRLRDEVLGIILRATYARRGRSVTRPSRARSTAAPEFLTAVEGITYPPLRERNQHGTSLFQDDFEKEAFAYIRDPP